MPNLYVPTNQLETYNVRVGSAENFDRETVACYHTEACTEKQNEKCAISEVHAMSKCPIIENDTGSRWLDLHTPELNQTYHLRQ